MPDVIRVTCYNQGNIDCNWKANNCVENSLLRCCNNLRWFTRGRYGLDALAKLTGDPNRNQNSLKYYNSS